jgi:hypothetical protein
VVGSNVWVVRAIYEPEYKPTASDEEEKEEEAETIKADKKDFLERGQQPER